MVERGGLENRCSLWLPGVRIPHSPQSRILGKHVQVLPTAGSGIAIPTEESRPLFAIYYRPCDLILTWLLFKKVNGDNIKLAEIRANPKCFF